MTQTTFIHSNPVDTSNIPSLITRLPARIHMESQLFDDASIDTISQYATPGSRAYMKALYRHNHPFGNMYALCFPETDIAKIECLARVLECLFIHDDMAEDMEYEDAQREHAAFMQGLLVKEVECSTVVDPQEAYLRELGSDMFAVDPLGTPKFLEELKQYLTRYDSSTENPKTIEEYIPYRIENAGGRISSAACQWAMSFRFTGAELDLVRDLERSYGILLGLINDYYSWNKEKSERMDRIRNAIPVLMQQYTLNENEAMECLKDIIFDEEERSKKLRGELFKTCDLSGDIVRYMDALEVHIGGLAYWCATCPRYNDPKPEGELY